MELLEYCDDYEEESQEGSSDMDKGVSRHEYSLRLLKNARESREIFETAPTLLEHHAHLTHAIVKLISKLLRDLRIRERN